MQEPKWIRQDVVHSVHGRQIAEHGGLDGVRDPGLLDSALSRPLNLFSYEQPPPDLADLAAAYAYGLAKNDPFLDGNKRTAFVICRLFLLVNGRDLSTDKEDRYFTFMKLSEGELEEKQLAAWIRDQLVGA